MNSGFFNENNGIIFGNHFMKVLQQILSYRTPSTITEKEQELVKNSGKLRNIDEKISEGLISLINFCKDFVNVEDSVMFLIDAETYGLTEDAVEALRIAVDENIVLTKEDLVRVLADCDNVPLIWMVNAIGEMKEEEEKKQPAIRKPSIDLERLKNFR